MTVLGIGDGKRGALSFCQNLGVFGVLAVYFSFLGCFVTMFLAMTIRVLMD
jgi:hypothetical protein